MRYKGVFDSLKSNNLHQQSIEIMTEQSIELPGSLKIGLEELTSSDAFFKFYLF